MTLHEAAILWLNKQLKKKRIALFNAEIKKNPSQKEIDDIQTSIAVIEYLIEITKSN